MQKKLIALAVAGLAAAPAFAQTNVTIYGVADATFDNVRASSTAAAGDKLGSTNRVSTNSSYLGFKGTEDLGNGLKAVFQFESGISSDQATGTWASRDSFVGLAGGFGTVVAGNLTGPTRALGAALDVNAGATGIGANTALIGKLSNALVGTTNANGNFTPTSYGTSSTASLVNGKVTNTSLVGCDRSSTCTSLFDTRWKNAIAYVSPSFAGVTVTAAYVANENHGFDAAPASAANTQGYDLGVNYNNGPILAGLTYNAVTLRDTNETRVSDLRLGGSYNFGVASVRALVERTSFQNVVGNMHQIVWGLGATYNVTTNGKIVSQFYRAQNVTGDLVAGIPAQTGAKLFELGYEHSLSKRTIVKAVYSYLGNDKNANYDYGINAAGINTAANGGLGAKLNGVQVGVRHSF
ncbi:porin [Oryzomicrobium sp.]|uniref:porin n=1 Tax=Oryzomicrobium sp. TaxID=1911578 RepID=UPI0025E9F717|nr:porin [Oryzomicrobium sp.]MCE1241634.1 porin [Oryzomicrobium sp.]